MVALMRLSELKLQLAVSSTRPRPVVDMLGGAMQNCRDKDELGMSCPRSADVGSRSSPRCDVGLTSRCGDCRVVGGWRWWATRAGGVAGGGLMAAHTRPRTWPCSGAPAHAALKAGQALPP